MEPKQQPAKQRWIVPALLGVIIVLLVALLLMRSCQAEPTTTIADNDVPRLGYAEGVVALDEDSLQQAVDKMNAQASESIGLQYKNGAQSEDGINFSCYIANAQRNDYDMYLQIFADEDFTDELYLSGLVRPGEAFQELTLNHSLDTGSHTVYIVFTQVEDDLATIHGQVIFTMDFVVSK